jgi:hypothetical protein
MEIAACLWGKVTIYTVLVEPPQELTKETSLVRRWIELKIGKVLLFLSKLRLKPNVNIKSQKITDIIADPHALITSYEHIKSKLRNMTPRGDDKRKTILGGGGGGEGTPFFLGINRRWFEHTAKRLRTRKYPFKPVRQVNIPKPGKPKETRLLAMVSLKDHQVI